MPIIKVPKTDIISDNQIVDIAGDKNLEKGMSIAENNSQLTLQIPTSSNSNVAYFASVKSRNDVKKFGILTADRRKHVYILGKTGMGKSTLLENLILQDIHNGNGVCFLDPHGDSAEYIIQRIPENRINDLIYINPADSQYPFGFNILEAENGEDDSLIVSGLMEIFARIWAGAWSSRMEYILANTLYALLSVEGTTLLGVVRLLTDTNYRNWVIDHITNATVKNFWVKEFAAFNDKYRTEAIAPILNKIGQFFSSDVTLNILGQSKSTINIRDIMNGSKILIINLSKGKIGEITMRLLGSLFVTKIQLAAMSRVNMSEEDRKDFYLYVDEFQNFTSDSFATILSEARKYRLALTVAHQYIKQLEETENEKVKNAIFGNVGTMMCFAIGAEDAQKIALEFAPVFSEQQLVSLSKHQIALKISIDGKASLPFLAQTLPPIFDEKLIPLNYAVQSSRLNCAVPYLQASKEIGDWLAVEYPEATKTEINNLKKSMSYTGAISQTYKKDGDSYGGYKKNNYSDKPKPSEPVDMVKPFENAFKNLLVVDDYTKPKVEPVRVSVEEAAPKKPYSKDATLNLSTGSNKPPVEKPKFQKDNRLDNKKSKIVSIDENLVIKFVKPIKIDHNKKKEIILDPVISPKVNFVPNQLSKLNQLKQKLSNNIVAPKVSPQATRIAGLKNLMNKNKN